VLPLRKVAEARDVTIKLSGMPAEESGEGEVLLLQRGVINHVTMEMMVHLAVEEAGSRASSQQASATGGAG
jgi:metal-dependent amidase/aminoacylase/carboxypeptidase family protein